MIIVTSTCGPGGGNGCPSFAEANDPEIKKTASRNTRGRGMAFFYIVKPQPSVYKMFEVNGKCRTVPIVLVITSCAVATP